MDDLESPRSGGQAFEAPVSSLFHPDGIGMGLYLFA